LKLKSIVAAVGLTLAVAGCAGKATKTTHPQPAATANRVRLAGMPASGHPVAPWLHTNTGEQRLYRAHRGTATCIHQPVTCTGGIMTPQKRRPLVRLPHPALVVSGPQLDKVITELEAGTYPPPEFAVWRDDLPREQAIRLARATGADDEQIQLEIRRTQ
jgi:hypothetical protein